MAILGSLVAKGAFAITPSASPLAVRATGIYVGVTGNVTITGADGVSVQFLNVPAGFTIPVEVTHVTAATATGLIGYRPYVAKN